MRGAMAYLLDQPKEHICCKCPLMCLIKDHHTISFQERIAHGFPQKHSIGQKPA